MEKTSQIQSEPLTKARKSYQLSQGYSNNANRDKQTDLANEIRILQTVQ